MNIVFVSNQPYPYGMAGSKRIRLFAEYLSVNHSVHVIVAGKNNGNNSNEGTIEKVDYTFTRFTRLQTFLAYKKIKKGLQKKYQSGQKNILFLYDGIGLTNFLFANIGRKLGFKIITDVVEDYSLHTEDTSFLLSALYKINTFFEKRTSKLADGVIVISSRLKDKFTNLNVDPEKLLLITISAENYKMEYKKSESGQKPFTFIYSGSYGNKDGLDYLVNAFKEFSKKKDNIQLLLAGKINQKTSTLIQSSDKIKYVGMIPDNEYYPFLATADLLLMTRVNTGYANSGFPFKLGEYLATGKPVIATRVSDIEHYLKDREDVLIAEPSNVASLVTLFDYAFKKQEEIKRIGINGKEKSMIFFNPEINGSKLEKFMHEI